MSTVEKTANPSSSKIMKVLIILRDPETKSFVKTILEGTYPGRLQISEFPMLQDGIEFLERNPSRFDLIILDQNSPSQTMLKIFIGFVQGAPLIICSPDLVILDALKAIPEATELVLTSELAEHFFKSMKRLAASGKLPELPPEDEQIYVSLKASALVASNKLASDLYVRLGQGHYVRVFKKGDILDQKDVDKYKSSSAMLFIKRSDLEGTLKAHSDKVEAAANKNEPPPTQAEAKEAFVASYDLVADVIKQIGFTPEAQTIAKSSVAITMKVLGGRPRLATILTELKKKEGNYIGAHSFMIGQVACAMAHKMGWSSATTFFKLTLAAFLHDICLDNAELAQVDSYEEAKLEGKLSSAELHTLLLHSLKASEYSKQFHEIPGDVDQIILQHHEKADGTGFPRQLTGKFINPLSALFIVSHDLVDYFLKHEGATADQFFEANSAKYQIGQFKKILTAIKASESDVS